METGLGFVTDLYVNNRSESYRRTNARNFIYCCSGIVG